MNRDVLLSIWISWEVCLFSNYFLYQNTWIPGRMNLFLSFLKWLGKKKQSAVRITVCPEQINQCPQYGDPAKKNAFFKGHLLVAVSAFWFLYPFEYLPVQSSSRLSAGNTCNHVSCFFVFLKSSVLAFCRNFWFLTS